MMKWLSILLSAGIIVLGLGCAHAQTPAKAPPALPATQAPVISPQPIVVHPPASAPNPVLPLDSFIGFDAEQKEVTVTNGTPEAHFTFSLTNISTGEVTINNVRPSCGCTVAKLPAQPWKLQPKDSGSFSATMQLAGTPPGGTKIKTLTVESDKGTRALYIKATVLAAPPGMSEADRVNNQKMAMADRQAIFKGDCVKCHVEPAKDSAGNDKQGKELFAAVCGVCHQAEHRASFVPDLNHLPEPTNAEFWKNWVMHGKPGTLMPGFAKSEGGILTDQQVESLVKYLTDTIPSKPVAGAIPMVRPPQ
jgi:mono/diheme cytochrome c family protein